MTIRTSPPAASCQRANSSVAGGRTCASGCAPLGPSLGEIDGPSTWMPAIILPAKGRVSCALRIADSRWQSAASEAVISVGRKAATPTLTSALHKASTASGVSLPSFRSWPPKPLT